MKSIKITETQDSNYFLITNDQIGQLEGWEYPTVISAIQDLPSKKGALYITSKYGRRRFSVMGSIKGQTYAQRIAMGLALRQTGVEKLLEFTTFNDLTLRAYVEVLDFKHKYTKWSKPFLIELVAADPRFYSQTLHDTEVADGDTETVNNAGNEITGPILKLSGAGTYWTVSNLTTGESFTLDFEITGGGYVEIDTENKTVLFNGTTSKFSDFAGDFFNLNPGNNSIKLEVVGGDVTSLLNVYHRDAYISI